MFRNKPSRYLGQTPAPLPSQTSLTSSGIPIPAELTAKDAQLAPAPSGTGLSQIIIISMVLGTVIGIFYMFFSLFRD